MPDFSYPFPIDRRLIGSCRTGSSLTARDQRNQVPKDLLALNNKSLIYIYTFPTILYKKRGATVPEKSAWLGVQLPLAAPNGVQWCEYGTVKEWGRR